MKTPSLLLAATLLMPGWLSAQTITSGVPGFISYQGTVLDNSGSPVGAGTPVNRTVTFRIWDHPSNVANSNLIYSEEQTVTISDGQFSVLVGQGVSTSTSPFGYSETPKGPPAFNIALAFGEETRYLGVTVDDGTAAVDNEITPRQRVVSSAFAFRAKFAEQIGTSAGTAITTLDNGNVGIGVTNPSRELSVRGGGVTMSLESTDNNYMLQLLQGGGSRGYLGANASNALLVANGSGSTLMELSADGKLSLNDTHKLGRLNVGGGSSATDALYVRSDGTTSEGGTIHHQDSTYAFRQYTASTGGTSGRLVFDAVERANPSNILKSSILTLRGDGHVGIGTNGPAADLHVVRGTSTAATTNVGNFITGRFENNTSNYLHVAATDTTEAGILFPNSTAWNRAGMVYNHNEDRMYFTSGGVNALHLRNGRVGIGTSDPSTLLELKDSATTLRVIGQSSSAALELTSYRNTFNHSSIIMRAARGTESAPQPLGSTDAAMELYGQARNTGGTFSNLARIYFAADGQVPVAFDSPGRMVFQTVPDGGGTLANRMVIDSDGHVGIGIDDPAFPLDVRGSVAFSLSGVTNYFFDKDSPLTQNATGSPQVGLLVGSGLVRAVGFVATSDARIKNIKGVADGASDLDVITQLKVTDYTLVDQIRQGGDARKGFIAQEVEAVVPEAVSQTTDFVPDVYAFVKETERNADKDETRIRLDKEHDLKEGDLIQVLADDSQVLEMKVKSVVSATEFVADGVHEWKTALVYGRQVDDFLAVDYDRIFVTAVSALQQLKKETDAEVAELKAENVLMKKRLAELEAKDRARDAKLVMIEKLLQAAQPKTASLKASE